MVLRGQPRGRVGRCRDSTFPRASRASPWRLSFFLRAQRASQSRAARSSCRAARDAVISRTEIHMAQSHRNLRVLGTLAGFACALALATLGCGGGTEVAPPTPLVDGDGLAQASLDGVSRGETRIVSAIVSSSTTQAVPVAGEVVQFGASQFLTTANHPLTLTPVTLTGPGGPYSAGVDQASCAADPTCQFWVEDYNAGAIGRNPS